MEYPSIEYPSIHGVIFYSSCIHSWSEYPSIRGVSFYPWWMHPHIEYPFNYGVSVHQSFYFQGNFLILVGKIKNWKSTDCFFSNILSQSLQIFRNYASSNLEKCHEKRLKTIGKSFVKNGKLGVKNKDRPKMQSVWERSRIPTPYNDEGGWKVGSLSWTKNFSRWHLKTERISKFKQPL